MVLSSIESLDILSTCLVGVESAILKLEKGLCDLVLGVRFWILKGVALCPYELVWLDIISFLALKSLYIEAAFEINVEF